MARVYLVGHPDVVTANVEC